MDDVQVAAAVLEPHFDAVRDVFVEFEPEPGENLAELRRTRLVVDPGVRDTSRHYGMCRDDGRMIKLAPQAADLDLETLTAIIAHEFGHAADFAYPGRWVPARERRASWIGEGGTWYYDDQGNAEWRAEPGRNGKRIRRWQCLWHERDADQVEWAADSIAYAVTGMKIRYCGPCMLQCFSAQGRARPKGLR